MPKMSMFTLAISCVITSNLPWFINLTVQVPVQYCSYKIGFYFHHQSRPQLGVGFGLAVSSFFLELCLHWSPVAYWAPTDLGSSSFSVLSFSFSYCSWGSQGKNTEVVCHSLLQWTTFCQNSPPWPVHLGWPYMAWLTVSLN